MINNIEIREMNVQDLEAIKNSLKTNFDDFWTYGILKSEIDNINSRYIVAIQDNEIVGFAGVLINIDSAEIMNIVVRKDMRKKGIGNILLKNLINCSKDLKCISITLEVNEKNLPAIELYIKNGFEKVGIRKKYYNNEYDAILMTKKI